MDKRELEQMQDEAQNSFGWGDDDSGLMGGVFLPVACCVAMWFLIGLAAWWFYGAGQI